MTTISDPGTRTLLINHLTLSHLDWGNAKAPPLVCVHGFRGNAHGFDGVAERFRDRLHVEATTTRQDGSALAAGRQGSSHGRG